MLLLTAVFYFAAMIDESGPSVVPDAKVAHADYAIPLLWLCRPDLKDNKCKADLSATVIPGDGKISIEKYVPAKDPKIDCFFVYPTVSLDPGYESDFIPAAHEAIDDIRTSSRDSKRLAGSSLRCIVRARLQRYAHRLVGGSRSVNAFPQVSKATAMFSMPGDNT